jgi:hypothetical protein
MTTILINLKQDGSGYATEAYWDNLNRPDYIGGSVAFDSLDETLNTYRLWLDGKEVAVYGKEDYDIVIGNI